MVVRRTLPSERGISMAVISPDSFDPMNRYVRVRLMQGVPIVDADVNEREDIQKFELQAFLKWFVGDGAPAGSDGFRITPTEPPAADFCVRSGITGAADALHNIGRYLVCGFDVMIDMDTTYNAQSLHKSRPGADALAGKWNVPVIDPLPVFDGPLLVYLDVWERCVMPTEKRSLVHSGLGVESCARHRREWVVRVTSGKLPRDTGGHVYAALASVQRRAADPVVYPGDITDLRHRGLLLPPATLIEDVFGMEAADYRQGLRRPVISLRRAINASLRGEWPTTPGAPLESEAVHSLIQPVFLADATGGLVAMWESIRQGNKNQVFASRAAITGTRPTFDADTQAAAGEFSPAVSITSGEVDHASPHAVLLPGGDLLVAYQTNNGSIMMKCGPLASLASQPEIPVISGASASSPFLVVTGDCVTIFFHKGGVDQWFYRRWKATQGFQGSSAERLSSMTASAEGFHAVAVGSNVWIAFPTFNDVQTIMFASSTSLPDQKDKLPALKEPFLLPRRTGGFSLYGRADTALKSIRYTGGAFQAAETVPGTTEADKDVAAVETDDGATWLFWSRPGTPTSAILAARRRAGGTWDPPQVITESTTANARPFALVGPDSTIWIFWSQEQGNLVKVYYKRLFTLV